MNRLDKTLDQTRGRALSIYLTSGHPDIQRAPKYFQAAIAGGADWLEFGIPFSDPGADGPVIEAASAASLAGGHRVADALSAARALRDDHPDVPLVAMTYANIAFQRGWERFAQDLSDAGFDGLILPDVPLEESGPIRAALSKHGLAWIPLVAPTTSAHRMRAIAEVCTGFLYVVGNVGITGQADPGPLVEATVARARSVTDKPLAVGFGIASAEDVRRVLDAGADAAIVGSRIVGMVSDGASPDDVQAAVAELRSRLPSQSS